MPRYCWACELTGYGCLPHNTDALPLMIPTHKDVKQVAVNDTAVAMIEYHESRGSAVTEDILVSSKFALNTHYQSPTPARSSSPFDRGRSHGIVHFTGTIELSIYLI